MLSNATSRPSADIEALLLLPLAWAPDASTLARVVVLPTRFRTKTSMTPFVSPATRFVEALSNATALPSRAMDGFALLPLPWIPPVVTLARVVVFVCRSRTKTSDVPLVSPATRLLARLSNATNRPSVVIEGLKQFPLPWTAPGPTLTRVIVAVCWSRTKMSRKPLASPTVRLLASLSKTT